MHFFLKILNHIVKSLTSRFDRWVMLVEKRICDVDGKLMIYHENLKRLKKRLDILKQIHEAPQVYAKLVVEVVRRRKFSTQFLKVLLFITSTENILMRKTPILNVQITLLA